jgi:hypothetical protein
MTDLIVSSDRPSGRSADTRPALVYLEMSGAVRISIDATGRIAGNKIRTDTVATFWVRAEQALPLARRARRHAGRGRVDPETRLAALHQAAADLHVTLTPHAVAISKAGEAAAKLNQYMDQLDRTGALRAFKKSYRQYRLAAAARGEGFLSFKNAELRLRRALVPYLIGNKPIAPGSLFAEIFRGLDR